MRNTILISLLLMLLPVSVSAQFYTITRYSEILPTERQKESYNRTAKDVTEGKKNKMMVKDTLTVRSDNLKESEGNSHNSDRKASLNTELQKNVDDITKAENNLPELTIPNLYKEIIRNGIPVSYTHLRAHETKANLISQNRIGSGYTGDRMVPFISMPEQA